MKIEVLGNGYVTDEVSTVLACEANLNEENRIKFVTDLAAVSRGKHESNNPPVRYKQLLKEAAPNNIDMDLDKQHGSPSRPLEFLPIVLDCQTLSTCPVLFNIVTKNGNFYNVSAESFLNKLAKFGYVVYNDLPHDQSVFKLYTNMRACLNAGIAYEDIPYNTTEELADFKAIRVKAPMFVFNHLVTHTALSKEARSERVTKLDPLDYWLPADFRTRVYNYVEMRNSMSWDEVIAKYGENEQSLSIASSALKTAKYFLTLKNKDDIILSLLSFTHTYGITENTTQLPLHLGQAEVQEFFKELGYKEEIYQRAMLEFRYKEFIMTGWKNNPYTWHHLCLERNTMPVLWKNWTQEETSNLVYAIRHIVFPELSNKEA